MATYTSSVGRQLAAVEKNADAFVFRTLKAAGHKFRTRLVRERLSRPVTGKVYPAEAKRLALAKAPLARKKGLLARDAQYLVTGTRGQRTLTVLIGRRAYYAEQHENSGRLHFRKIAQQELEQALESIRIGLPLAISGASRPSSFHPEGLSLADEAALAIKERVFSARRDTRGLRTDFKGSSLLPPREIPLRRRR